VKKGFAMSRRENRGLRSTSHCGYVVYHELADFPAVPAYTSRYGYPPPRRICIAGGGIVVLFIRPFWSPATGFRGPPNRV
jgi:hypothetical protein